jgi:hypothetical protein
VRVTLSPLARNARYPGLDFFSASIRLTVRITSSASPDSRLPRLAPPSTSSPMPDERRRSISAQSCGAEHVISVAVSFSTQRNAGMSSFDPSRIPAWLAPVCEERSVSHSLSTCVSSASQRAMVGALPSRIARCSTGSASPSISRNTIPGTSVLAMIPCRRAMRCAIRTEDMSSVPRITASTTLTAATTSEVRRAQPKPSTVSTPSVRLSVRRRMPASAIRDEQEAEHQRGRQAHCGQHGRDDRVQRRRDRRDEQRAPEALDADAGQDPGGHHEGDPRGKPRDQGRETTASAVARSASPSTRRRPARIR